jgi:SAM-dependent methyltransferase
LLNHHIGRVLDTYASPAPANGRCLDVGCGEQPLRQPIESLGYTYVGLDVMQNQGRNVDFVCAIDGPLPAELARPFDFVICTEVLEHVADWQAAFDNLRELTAPGSRVLITCPFFYPLHEEPHDFWRATPYALEYAANRAGFRIVEQTSAGDAWDALTGLLGHFGLAAGDARLTTRMLLFVAKAFRRLLFLLLRTRLLQRRLRVRTPLYVSNILVLERPPVAIRP